MTSTRVRLLCGVEGCYVPGKHTKACLDTKAPIQCDGCQPGQALDGGLLVCGHHHYRGVRALAGLPDLYGQLGTALIPYRSPQAPKGDGARTGDEHGLEAFIDGDPFQARIDMLEGLAKLAAFVSVEKGITMPRGDVRLMVAFLKRWAEWMSANRVLAPTWSDRVYEIAGEARKVANRSRTSGIFLGTCPVTIAKDGEPTPCGGPIRYESESEDPTWQITCRRCNTTDTLEWWREQIVGAVADDEQMPAGPLAMLLAQTLSAEFGVHAAITPSTISMWRQRGHIDPVDPDARPQLWVRAEVEAHARKVYAKVAAERAS